MARKRKATAKAPTSTNGESQPVPVAGIGWQRGAAEEADEVAYLWQPWVPLAGLTLLAGDPARGKSTLLAHLIAGMTSPRADSPRDIQPRPHVLLVSGEEDWATATLPRLLEAGADPGRVIRLNRKTRPGGRITVAELCDEAPALCSAHNVGLIVLDPLAACAPGDSDWNVEGPARVALDALQGLAELTRAAVIVSRNTNKNRTGALLDRITGSAAFRDVPRSVLFVLADPLTSGRYILCQPKSSIGEPGEPISYELYRAKGIVPMWRELGKSALSAEELGDAPSIGGERLEWQAAHELLRGMIGNSECEARKLLKAAADIGIGKSKLWRAANELGIGRRRVGFGPGSHVCWVQPKRGWPEL